MGNKRIAMGHQQVDVGAVWRKAEQLRMSGDEDGARDRYADLTRIPGIAGYAHLRLADLAMAAGALRRATSHALQAHALATGDPALLAPLCRQLLAVGEDRAAIETAERLGEVSGAPFPMLAEIAKRLSDAMAPDAALTLLARSRAAGLPASSGASYLEGLNRLYRGELDQAFEALVESTVLDPAFAPAYWSLAKMRRADGRGHRIDRLESLVARHPQAHPDAPLWLYSLFHELDADDQVERAWPVLERAMRARARQVPYDEPRELALLERLGQGMPAWAAHALPPAKDDDGEPVPVMVVGLPRTGTTVIEQALCRSRDLHAAGELHDFVRQMRWIADQPGAPSPDEGLLDAIKPAHLHELGARYVAHTAWRARGASRYSDKWPENYLIMGHAMASLPRLRVLAVRRDPMDACWSNLREWFGAAYRYSYDLGQVARRQLAYTCLLDHACEAFGERIVVVDYEAFVREPETLTGMVANALALPERTSAAPAATIATASAVQVRGRITDANIGAWRRYERWLGPLQAALERGGRIDGYRG